MALDFGIRAIFFKMQINFARHQFLATILRTHKNPVAAISVVMFIEIFRNYQCPAIQRTWDLLKLAFLKMTQSFLVLELTDSIILVF